MPFVIGAVSGIAGQLIAKAIYGQPEFLIGTSIGLALTVGGMVLYFKLTENK